MRIKFAIFLLMAGLAHGVDLDARHFYVTNDVSSARPAVSPLRWYQGESVKMDLYVRRGANPVDLSASGLYPRWEVFLESDQSTAYVMSTGTIANATNGYITFSLTPATANLPTNTYKSYVKLYQPIAGTNTYVGMVYKTDAQVYWSPSATNFTYVGPYTNSTETDPIWQSEKSGYVTNGANISGFNNDSAYITLGDVPAQTTQVYVAQAGTAQVAAAYSETDPVWVSESNLYYLASNPDSYVASGDDISTLSNNVQYLRTLNVQVAGGLTSSEITPGTITLDGSEFLTNAVAGANITIGITNQVAYITGQAGGDPIDSRAVTNNINMAGYTVTNARYDSSTIPYQLTASAGTATVSRAFGDTLYLVCTGNTEIVFDSTFPTAQVGRVSIDVNPQSFTITLSTNNYTWTTTPTFTASEINPTYFRKKYGSAMWEVRQ